MTTLTRPHDPPLLESDSGAGRSVRFGRRRYPVILPTRRDPRLHLAAVIISLQVLGQTVLGFELSIAQILVALATCAVLEVGITFFRRHTIAWPASALLTGNGVAFILRVPGTRHGDWWATNGWYYFAGIAAVSLLSKYAIRYKGRHLFNPSNFGLVAGFLVLGSNRVEPLDFWWGPIGPAVAAAIVIIVCGGLLILSRLKMLGMAIAFWITFAVSLAVVAAAGHCMTARWRFGAVCDGSFWWVLVTSPEILVFCFFMITDPKTTPAGRVARLVFGVAVAFEAALFVATQQTEFGTKVAVLASLTAICAVRPYLEKFFPAPGSAGDSARVWLARLGGRHAPWRRPAAIGGVVLMAGASLVVAGTPARTAPVATSQPAGTPVPRPDVPLDLTSLPAVTIDPNVRRVDADITQARAEQMARDAVTDLRIEADARQRGDREMAATATAWARLDAVVGDIDAGRQTGQITASTYSFDSLKIVLVYDTANAQAGPQYGLEARGAERRVTYEGSTAPRVVDETSSPFERTFALLYRNGAYLLAADYPPA
ncbi:MAG: RnfABCDGE type electron transport complex subunit D [Actinobacteria bacterium]|nr:RnfABCDGE type electron transport complex subunit D [Actinomycetota bacterium]